MKLILSIIFLILALASWAASAVYFVFGIPLGLLFLSFSIWLFATWRYKKLITLNTGGWLFLLPALGFLPVLTANGNFGLVNLFFSNNLPPSQVPWWGVLLGMVDAFVLPLLWWGVLLLVIIYFFRQARKIV